MWATEHITAEKNADTNENKETQKDKDVWATTTINIIDRKIEETKKM